MNMEDRIKELEKLSEKLWEEFLETKDLYGTESALTRIAKREWCNLEDVLSYIRGESISRYDYLVREMIHTPT